MPSFPSPSRHPESSLAVAAIAAESKSDDLLKVMSGIWTHVDGCFDRATSRLSGSSQRHTIGSNQYNKPGSSFLADPSSSSATLSARAQSSLNTLTSPAIPSTHPRSASNPIDMRTFSVKGIFGVSASLATSMPGKLSISFPSITRGFRARSEPLPPTKDEDVVMASPELIPRSRSECMIRIPREDRTPVSGCDTRDTVETMEEEPLEECEDVTITARAPSPAATEIHDPDSQDIIVDLKTQGIKVRDFAFTPSTNASLIPPPVTEVFDQYRALTEIDYRWSQPERNYPVQGKTLRRLLDMGWLTQTDMLARGAPMDFAELDKFDSRPNYPWRPFRRTSIPSLAERRDMLTARRGYWVQIDKIRAHMNRELERRLEEERRVALVAAQLEDMDRAMQASGGKGKGREGSPSSGSKRRLEADDGEDAMNTAGDSEVDPFMENGSAPKKRRITPEPSYSQSQDPYTTTFVAPIKQYPAPLHTYNPELYPDAASIIESSSQSQSQPRPVVPERSDTPPLDAEEQESQRWSPGKGTKLVHPRHQKALKKALSRTQTFAQL